MNINGIEFNASLQDILDELISQLRINNIQYIQKMHDTEKDIQICCPYHSNGMEKRPSAGIRKTDGKFHCFACGEIHELYEVISYCFGYVNDTLGSFGWKWLMKNFATIQVEYRKPLELNLTRNVKKQKIEYVSEKELESYRYIHPYMYERGLTDEVIEAFDIGYDKNTRCITFPVRDKSGGTLFVARRSVDSKYFNYPKETEKPLYGLYELYQQRIFPSTVIICESMLDALSFWTIKKYAVALNGLGTQLQFKQLRQLPCRKLILCTDMDGPGMKARIKLRKNITNKLIMEYLLPNGKKDANECTKEELKSLEEIL